MRTYPHGAALHSGQAKMGSSTLQDFFRGALASAMAGES